MLRPDRQERRPHRRRELLRLTTRAPRATRPPTRHAARARQEHPSPGRPAGRRHRRRPGRPDRRHTPGRTWPAVQGPRERPRCRRGGGRVGTRALVQPVTLPGGRRRPPLAHGHVVGGAGQRHAADRRGPGRAVLRPLSNVPALAPHIRYGARAEAISRDGIDRAKTAGRKDVPFVTVRVPPLGLADQGGPGRPQGCGSHRPTRRPGWPSCSPTGSGRWSWPPAPPSTSTTCVSPAPFARAWTAGHWTSSSPPGSST
jgi:hypothetical protein